ncbi:RluA family pseudouridine synthase [Aquibacillus sp. 3ASR75-11]|uniref:Pseudouridine synthase n=1 Tax=Terrihalobacillus insolitus TaxID=2950438 RepID=A0A9X4AP60_9BACI|nr:RluA family pseudouridine synthase [Terrihalobacillus insolitus]MDC3413482.1 RluA family pseudouridine synthase [Terrihalobacillus insolitus]MDC3425228.1 RluA family pseudouridine synthase [Terrihalobacillus insolitus]
MYGHKKGTSNQTNKSLTYKVKEPVELLPFLLEVINRGRNSVKSMLTRGQVSVDNEVQTAYDYSLQPGQAVTIYKNKVVKEASLMDLTILHEDEDIIVINKEAGLLSISSPNEKTMTAYRQLMNHVRRENPSNRIFVVHRLDRDTSGVMMFAKKESVKRKLQNSWKDIVQERTYVALVEGQMKKPEGTISSWLKESSTHKMYSSPDKNGGQLAVTHYKVKQTNKQFSLLEVQLETGRKNQIRVHMQDLGHPIVGDKKYGSKLNPIGRLGLHAKVLAFLHPTKGELMRFEANVPSSFFSKI